VYANVASAVLATRGTHSRNITESFADELRQLISLVYCKEIEIKISYEFEFLPRSRTATVPQFHVILTAVSTVRFDRSTVCWCVCVCV